MGNLISILNSGEALEKAVILTKLALEHNSSFYSSYDHVQTLYFENLPRKKSSPRAHGTIGGLLENLDTKKYTGYSSYEDLWDDRDKILDILCSKRRITERMKEKIRFNKARFDKIIPNIPWYFIFEKFRDLLVNQVIGNKASLEYVDFKDISFKVIDKAPNPDCWSRPYILNPDGIVSSRYFWKGWSKTANKNQVEPIKRSIVLSPNIHLFLKGVYYSFCDSDRDISIGFRKFSRSRRPSYDSGIEFLFKQMNSQCVEEPRNVLFNRLLDEVDRNYGEIHPEKKVNLAVYGYLNGML